MADTALSVTGVTTDLSEQAALEQRLARLQSYRAVDPDNVQLAWDCAELCYRSASLCASLFPIRRFINAKAAVIRKPDAIEI